MLSLRSLATGAPGRLVDLARGLACNGVKRRRPPSVLPRANLAHGVKPAGLTARPLHTASPLRHGDEELKDVPDTIRVTFVTKDGKEIEVMAKEGERALYLAHRYGIDMEGACEASLACTTCHCYVEGEAEEGGDDSDKEPFFDRLPEATETEEDLLDMAPFLAVNSRLGCQVILAPELDGIRLRLPRATKNFYVDGHVPQPH